MAFVPDGTSSHSQAYLDAGKTEAAHKAIVYSAKILAATAYDLIAEPEKLYEVKKEFKETLANMSKV